ncbi:MAG TPA: HD domain-containing protein [Candidatus Fimadaptatus faecigallinarum]|uniref:HD domain-containing protein n=1 Tax=Candidatus Fimadaptatus faecigallinarum TaxID=2840814 RepID=A0A9D1S4R7_9FIRM|nr:HD domain-containing protein [Candidatus Fimadaptatus faecigallinarum]
MEQAMLSSVKKQTAFEGFLRVKAAQQRQAVSGSKYLDMTLADISCEVNAKMWDGTVLPPEPGTVIKVRGLMQEYNGRAQFRVDRMRPMNDSDNVDMSRLIACAPYPPQDMLDAILEVALAIKNDALKNIVLERLDEVNDRLLYYPAAQRIHHAERAGLLHHTLTVLKCAEALLPIYPFLDGDLLRAGVILHDLCKTDEMNSDNMGLVSGYTRAGQLLGHLVQGAIEVDRVARKVGAPDELREMLEHMLLSHHDIPEYGSPKPPMFPEAEMLALLDRMDARMYEMSHTISCIAPGEFTDKVWSLDRRLYRREAPPAEPEGGK